MSQFIPRIVGKIFGSAPRHALGFGAVLTVAVIAARINAERKAAAEYGRHAAPVESIPFADPAAAVRAALVTTVDPDRPKYPAAPADPTPTLPLSRAALAEVIEVSGGRPMHDLDLVQRACRHADSLNGRCADCGMTWAAQADAMGGAR
ncbi:hypothetical protein [Nocardia sp. No.11]|uniref:hypothetical protein n=1 Tax=Nocardia sp. No.11 TaxID=3128861 RepID=UPI00319DA8C5